MWRQRCCQYSVRSYFRAGDVASGETQWTADYWFKSTASVFGALKVAIDATGNVYVAGPRTSDGNGTYWSLVKYDGATGHELFKADCGGDLLAVLVASWDANHVYVLRDDDVIQTLNNNDGTLASSTSSVTNATDLMVDEIGEVVQSVPYGIGFFSGPTGLPLFQKIEGGRIVTLGNNEEASDTGNQLSLIDWPVVFPDPLSNHQLWQMQGYSDWPHGSPRSVDLITGGTDQLLAVSVDPMYLHNSPEVTARLALLDTGLDTGLIWTGSYAGAAFPFTARWYDSSTRWRSVLKFQDTTYLITGANTSPTVQALQVSDGTQVWGHLHLQPTGIAVDDNAIVTVGTRKTKLTDVDFVT